MSFRIKAVTTTYLSLARFKEGHSAAGTLADADIAYLSRDNPSLIDLQSRYAACSDLKHSHWSVYEANVDLHKFRGENDYLTQSYFRGTLQKYQLTTAYVELIDEMGLLDALHEDSLFGAKTWNTLQARTVTRDLLDSILEITFIKNALGLTPTSNAHGLDIGAGYGRFAHRFVNAFSAGRIACTDAIATSTFVCDYYLRFRQCAPRASVVPFDQLGQLKVGVFDFAVNIHSWSECTYVFIQFWLALLADLRVRYLFIVPHSFGLLTKEVGGTKKGYADLLPRFGYKLKIQARKYQRSEVVDHLGVFPTDYWLFERS